MNCRRILPACVLAALLAGCQHGEGRMVRVLPTSESILGQAAHVVRARVVARDPIEIPYKQGRVSCGAYYRVEVLDALKGESGDTLDFVADEPLAVGGEYLVAVRESPGSLDPNASWDTEKLRCSAGYQRLVSDAARLEPGVDGMVVVVKGARMLPDRIRDEAVGGRVPWPTVKRELFGPEEASLEQQVEELTAPEPEAVSPEAPPAPPQPPQSPPAPEAPEPDHGPWLWEWDL